MKRVLARPEHEVAYQDLVTLLRKHSEKISAEEMLGIAANLVGKLIAMQDQRTMTRDRALAIVSANLEAGNAMVLDEITNNTAGSA